MKWTTTGRDDHPQLSSGEALKQWRKARGWNRRAAAKALDIPYATYCRYEQGTQPPLSRANRIVAGTRGVVRYRDLWPHFRPEFA